MRYDGSLRALWCAAKAAGGTLRIGPSTLQGYPGDKKVFVTIGTDAQFGDLVITAHLSEDEERIRTHE